MPNRLAAEPSPYLRQHQDNPVDWYPWGAEAFERARAEDRPIFLSVGYSSCHWCHVMEQESFVDEEVASLLNQHFVSVKVDREERPDVDEAYMAAVQLSSGRGGWPMSVFLTPDRKPFFAGTYFPKRDRGQHPGLLSILAQLAAAWRDQRSKIQELADSFAASLAEALAKEPPKTFAALDEKLLEEAVAAIAADFDPKNGGFGNAPKFPPHTTIELLMLYALRPHGPQELREGALGMALITLERIALGGIHDHVGGGFHRYATDASWHLPHFEKMLYDNALLLGDFTRAAGIAQELDPRMASLFMRTAGGIIDFVQREMTSPEGLFYSALDADSEGEEGKYYVWSVDEVREVLTDRAPEFIASYGLSEEGNFEDEASGSRIGANVLHPLADPQGRFEQELALLRQARDARVRPSLDNKALVGWNGMMIGALAEAGALSLAESAAGAILQHESAFGRLPHQIVHGRPSGYAFFEDYAHFVDGLLRLAAYWEFLEENREVLAREGLELRPELRSAMWREEARRLCQDMVDRFYDEKVGGFFGTSTDHEELFGRTKPVFDQPSPSANGIAVRCLLDLRDEAKARQTLEAFVGWMQRAPQATEALLCSAISLLEAPPTLDSSGTQPARTVQRDGATAVLAHKELIVDAQGWADGEVVIEVPDGMHINSHDPPARWLTPTTIEIRPLKFRVDYPVPDEDAYRGTLRIPFSVELPSGQSGAELEVLVGYQACTDSECLLPTEQRLSATVRR